MRNILNELEALQKRYFNAIDEAYQARSVLGETIFETMRQDLFNRYKIERNQLIETAKIPDRNKNFEIRLQINELTPRQIGPFWLRKNEAKRLKIRETAAEDRSELELRIAAVEALEQTLRESNDPDPREVLYGQKPKRRIFRKALKRPAVTQPAAEQNGNGSVATTPNSVQTIAPPQVRRGRKPKTCATDLPAENAGRTVKDNGQIQGQLRIDDVADTPGEK